LDEKKIYKGIKLIFAIDKAKTVSVTERKLEELKSLLTELEKLENIKNEIADEYNSERWSTFVFKVVAYYQRHEQKYINETNTPSTLMLSTPGKSIKEWENLKESKLKAKTNSKSPNG
jgi:methanogenic corrinoid protein MtbC1